MARAIFQVIALRGWNRSMLIVSYAEHVLSKILLQGYNKIASFAI